MIATLFRLQLLETGLMDWRAKGLAVESDA